MEGVVKLPWFIAAFGAALVWGIHYPLLEFALKRLSLISVLLLTAVPIILVAPFFYRELVTDIAVLRGLELPSRLAISVLALTSLAAPVLLFTAIDGKNATLASLIEISYPLFVVLFTYVFFRAMHLNASVALGAVLIFAGVIIIIVNNP